MVGRIEDLQRQIDRGQVLAIVGAGVSIAASGRHPVASWTGLLHHGVDHCMLKANPTPPENWRRRAHEAIDEGQLDDLLNYAEQIEWKLGAPGDGRYRTWLRETVGSLPLQDRSVLEALHALGVPIATTNYDGLIETVTGLRPLTWRQPALAHRAVRGEEPAVLHLHGHWEDPESVILGVRSYEDVRRDGHAQAIQQALAATRTLLFVGCGAGLEDPNIGALLAWIGTHFKGAEYEHFRLCRDGEVAEIQKIHSPEQRVEALVYGTEHADLARFLRDGLHPARSAAAPITAPPAPAVLPGKPRCFGREAIVDELVAAVLAPEPAAVSVLGGPGMGKTTVTLAALHHPRVAAAFGTRRWFVRLDGATTADAILTETATAMALPPGPDLAQRVIAGLAAGPALLVLDNTETPWHADTLATEEVLAQLAGIPGVALVASIRGTARPLHVPWGTDIEVGRLSPEAARALFVSVAGARHTADPQLDGLLEALDRVAIAVELMAHVARGTSLADLRERWTAERTAMLRYGPANHRLTSVEVSYEVSIKGPLMTGEARRLLGLLGLLPGGIAHADLDTLLPKAGRRAAGTLRDLGLAHDEGPRLRVLAPLREHAVANHPARPEDRERAVGHFTALAADGEKAGWSGGREAIARLIPEVANVEAMLVHGLNGDHWLNAVEGALGYGKFALTSGHGTLLPLDRAVEAARGWSDTFRLARCLDRIGDILLARSRHHEAAARFQEALPLYRTARSTLGEANCIYSLGDIALRRSALDDAAARYQDALPLFQTAGDTLGEANCIKGLGDIALHRFALDDAAARFQDALPLYRSVGDTLGEANCINGLGDIALNRSELDDARVRYQEALPLYRTVGNTLGEANCIYRLGDIAQRHSALDAAAAHYRDALPLYRTVGSMLGEANCILGLGDIAFKRSASDDAVMHWEDALPLYVHLGEPYSIGQSHRRLARVAATGEERRAHVDAARAAWTSINRDDLVAELDAEFGPPD